MVRALPRKSKHADVFEKKFGSDDYVQTYYPPCARVNRLREALTHIQKVTNKHHPISIDAVVRRTHVSDELAENIIVFGFQAKVTAVLLEAYIGKKASLMDVGGGPTIYQHIGPSLAVQHITHGEYLKRNRAAVRAWLTGKPGAHNWDGYLELMRTILRNDRAFVAFLKNAEHSLYSTVAKHARKVRTLLSQKTSAALRKHIRQIIHDDVVPVNVFKPLFGRPRARKHYDVVTSHFVTESATGNKSEWRRGMQHLMRSVRDDGFLVVSAIRNASWYPVGTEHLPAVRVSEDDFVRLCAEENFVVRELWVLEGSDPAHVGYDGMVLLFAQKRA